MRIGMKRPDSHIKEDESYRYVEEVLQEWVLNPLRKDYGIDYDIQVFENGESTDLNFGAQIKSTDSSRMDDKYFKISLDTKHIDDFFKQNRPILLIVYDRPRKNAYWVIMQDYVWDVLNKEKTNWLKQKTSTIRLPLKNVLTNKEGIIKAVRNSLQRIHVHNFYNLSAYDGLGLNDTLDDIEKLQLFEERTEYVLNSKKLLLAQKLEKTGDYEAVVRKLKEVYSQNKKDLVHLKAIIALIAYCGIRNLEENQRVVTLSDEGLEIAEQLQKKTERAIILVYRAQAVHFFITRKIVESLYAAKAMEGTDFSYIITIEANKRIKQFVEILSKVSQDVRYALGLLIDSADYYIFTYLLTICLQMATTSLQSIGVLVGRDKFKEQTEANDDIARRLLKLINVFEDTELELSIRESVANYYYFTEKVKEGLGVLEPALILAEKLEDQRQTRIINTMIKVFKMKPDPYKVEEPNLDELSTERYSEMTKQHIEFMGEDLEDDSDTSHTLNLGLTDMNPEPYLKYCEELHIYYTSTSPLGEAFGVPTIGYKLLWCKFGKVTLNFQLQEGFENHKEDFCKTCKHRKPRADDWVCIVGWFKEREVPTPIEEFANNMRNWGVRTN